MIVDFVLTKKNKIDPTFLFFKGESRKLLDAV